MVGQAHCNQQGNTVVSSAKEYTLKLTSTSLSAAVDEHVLVGIIADGHTEVGSYSRVATYIADV